MRPTQRSVPHQDQEEDGQSQQNPYFVTEHKYDNEFALQYPEGDFPALTQVH